MDYMLLLEMLVATDMVLKMLLSMSSAELTWSCYEETGSCYYLPDFTRAQDEASCWCQSSGGHMVKIDSQEELGLLRQLMANQNRLEGFLIGATDHRTEGHFIWEDGSSAGDVIPWKSGEPNNKHGAEHCVALHNNLWWDNPPRPLPGYLAFDTPCKSPRLFVCERNQLSTRRWEIRSRDEMYPSASLRSISVRSVVECAGHCQEDCRCQSFAYQHSQHGPSCYLLNTHFSRLTTPQNSTGYVIYD